MHLFSKENIWSNPHASSHPDKYNNSVDRIISKEEEREDPRRELQSSSSTVVFPQILQELQCFHTQSSHPVQRNYSTYRINSSSPRTTRLIPCRLLPATVPRAPSNSTRQAPAIRLPTAFQGHTAQAGFQ